MPREKRIAETLDRATLHRMFSTPHKCMTWLESVLWENGIPVCPRCHRTDRVRNGRRSHTYHCRECLRWFNVRTGTALHATKRPLIDWIIAMHIMVTARKGISALQLSKELGVEYRTAWHLLHRLRFACTYPAGKLGGNIVEGDEHYMGGKQKNKHVDKKVEGAQGGAAMVRIVGICDRVTGETRLLYTPDKSDESLIAHIYENVELGTAISTDELMAYKKLNADYPHLSVCHSQKEWKKGDATVNSMESRWAVIVRTITGTYHHISIKDLPLYLREMAFRFNQGNCERDTLDRMADLARGMAGRMLPLEKLVGRERKDRRRRFRKGRAQSRKRAPAIYRGYAAEKRGRLVS